MAFKIGKQWLINPEMGDIRSRSQHTISSARFFTRGGDNLLHLWAHDMQNFQLVRASRFWLLLVLRRIKSQIVVLSSPVHEMAGWLFSVPPYRILIISPRRCRRHRLLPTLSRDYCSSSLRLINDPTLLIAK